jgi:DNA-binding NarL/FixJ family response regulator
MSSSSIRLIIAEDDFLVCEELKRILRNSPYEVIGEAGNGLEVIDLVEKLKPDVILMDIMMPIMDGLEASRQITEKYPTPIIVMTAYEATDLVETASQSGVSAFLTKPPVLAEIDRAVSIALARHDDLMELRRINQELQAALAEIKTLRGILPLCSFCKKIKLPDGTWENVDTHINKHTEAQVSHSLCPDCYRIHYPEIYLADLKMKKS